MKHILITTGDRDGIGFEVTAKSLYKLGTKKDVRFILFKSDYKTKKWDQIIAKKFKKSLNLKVSNHNPEQLKNIINENPKFNLIVLESDQSPAKWFEDSVKFCTNNSHSALVTGPISKPLFDLYDPGVLGHTGLLKKLFPGTTPQMGFIGRHFNVLLATDHIPLNKVPKVLNAVKLGQTLRNAQLLKSFLNPIQKNKPIGWLGLNPHAGDQRLIGEEDQKIKDWIHNYSKKNQKIMGPLVPDSAFLSSEWKKYSLYVALYHDQGLIPFKMIHGQDSGVHITLGIPILRTSVDHGTAKNIFNKGLANPNSMYDCLAFSIKVLKSAQYSQIFGNKLGEI